MKISGYPIIRPSIPVSDYVRMHLEGSAWHILASSLSRVIEYIVGEKILIALPIAWAGLPPELLKNAKTISTLQENGLIGQITFQNFDFPDEPYMHQVWVHGYGFGHDYFDFERALWKALGEGIERFLWVHTDNFYRGKTTQGSIKSMGARAMKIDNLPGFSEQQKKNNHQLFFTNDTVFEWYPARSLTQQRSIFCPLQLLSEQYMILTEEPMLRWSMTTGLATGNTLSHALVSGILECIERDAFMITYLNTLTPPQINLTHLAKEDSKISHILQTSARYHLETYAVKLFTDFPVSVVLGIVIDRTGRGPALSVGARASFNERQAIIDALSEAQASRSYIRTIFNDPFEKDNFGRRAHLQYWSKMENLPKIEFLLRGEKENAARKHSDISIEEQLETLVNLFRVKEYELCFAELSETSILPSLSIRSVVVVAPDLQPLHLEEKFPYFDGPRLKEVPRSLGLVPAEKINTEPHPFP
ncbi:MAG TPA: YcaO-like family protein [Candidatus Paceibacterota bacterium]|nr:YcaO-like family protein [Candidatus Paceibacterota bacterium]